MFRKFNNQLEQNNTFKVEHKINYEHLILEISKDAQFTEAIIEILTPKILDMLEKKYNFYPSDKYLEEAQKKEEYINKLDSFIIEKQKINQTFEENISAFLINTSKNLENSLKNFTNELYKQVSNNNSDLIHNAKIKDNQHE